jgi:hypothetical protein
MPCHVILLTLIYLQAYAVQEAPDVNLPAAFEEAPLDAVDAVC